jgi:hypothetical protein
MDREAQRARIRSEIKPFPREAHYPTGWNGDMSFAEIRQILTPSINRLMRYYRYVEVDIPDMIAHSFMRLWEDLSKTPDLLAEMDIGGATKYVMYRSGSSHYKKFYRREMYLEDLATRSGDPDEFVIEGYDHSHRIGYATYAEAIDRRIDIEQVMRYMAEKYQHSRAHLVALYYITTNVTLEDAAELAERGGSKTCWWLTSVVKPIREELCELFGLSRPGKLTWQEKLQAGEKQPLLTLVERFEKAGDQRMTATLLALAEHGSTKSLMEQLELPKSHVHYLRRTAHQELNKVYQCRSA